MAMNNDLPYSDAYWVTPEKFMAGSYPGVSGEEYSRKRVQALLKCGITTFIDLTKPGDSNYPYRDLLYNEADDYGIVVSWKNYSITDLGVPSISFMSEILDEIDAAIKSEKKVYLHCLAGIGRTGTVVGCYLVRHGLPRHVVLEQIALLRKDTPSWWCASPEIPQQVDFILKWNEGR